MEKKSVDKFVKFNSFEHFQVFNNFEKNEIIQKLKKSQNNLEQYSNYKRKIISKALNDIFSNQDGDDMFKLKDNTIAELKSINEEDYPEYLFHRYRYEMINKDNYHMVTDEFHQELPFQSLL